MTEEGPWQEQGAIGGLPGASSAGPGASSKVWLEQSVAC